MGPPGTSKLIWLDSARLPISGGTARLRAILAQNLGMHSGGDGFAYFCGIVLRPLSSEVAFQP
jgi:hypothetical protein